jgi:anti-anti-sigma regulatory factor
MAETWTVVQAPDVIEGATAVGLVRAALGAGSSVEIDMTGTEMLTSEGCTALLEISEVLTAEGASLVLRLGPSRIVHEVLRITGLDAMFSIVDDVVQSVS